MKRAWHIAANQEPLLHPLVYALAASALLFTDNTVNCHLDPGLTLVSENWGSLAAYQS